MKCPKCQYENKDEAKFCRKCGSPLELICPKCKHPNEPDSIFCEECGTKLDEIKTETTIPKLEDMQDKLYIPEPLRQRMDSAKQELQGENRLVTALFADISGFTPLSNQHSTEKVVDVVNQCFKVIIDTVFRYEGDPNRFIGDNVLAFFGAPIAHENDPERAIMAGLEIRDKVRELSLDVSIGINTGMMYFGSIGTREHHEVSAYGPDINLAKRLQETAEPGQILVGSGTHRLTRRAFDFDVIQSLNLKGFDQPITAYSVQQMKLHPEKLRGIEGLRARMIGREHEFAEVKEATDEWLSGHGQIVSVIGEAGIGKSRLVSEMKSYLDRMPLNPPFPPFQGGTQSPPSERGIKGDLKPLILEGRCVSIGQPISYWPFIDILKTYFNLSEGDDTATIASKVTDSITQLMPQSANETLPLLGQLLSIKYGNELDDRLKFATPEQIRHQTLMRLRDVFETLAKRQPLLLIIEDLHWSDDLSLDLISLLMDELANTPLMLLCVYRPEKEHLISHLSDQAQRKCLDRYTEITLRKLSTVESRQLVDELLTIDNLPESVKSMILDKSEGNPFFIEEVIRSLIDRDLVYREGERWKARDEVSSIDVPDTIQNVILARVDRLQAEAKYVLQCASVIGRLFKYRLLEHLSKQERNLNSYLVEFEEKDLVYPEHTIPELEYAFKHALTQEATYQSILERKQKEFHLQVAQGIERLYQERLEEYYEELAEHYSRSDDVEKAIEYLLKAGEKAEISYANESAISYYKKILEIMECHEIKQNEWRLKASLGLGTIFSRIGDHIEAEKYYDIAIELGKEMELPNRRMAMLYYLKVGAAPFQLRFEDTIHYANIGLDILGDDNECIEAALLNNLLSVCHINQYKFTPEYVQRNMSFVKKLDYSNLDSLYREYYGEIFGHIGFYRAYINRDPETAMEYYKYYANLAEKNHDLIGYGSALLSEGDILSSKGDYINSTILIRKALPIFERSGIINAIAGCYLGSGIASNALVGIPVILGNIDEAASYIPVLSDLARQLQHDMVNEFMTDRTLGNIYMLKRDWESAISNYEKQLETSKKHNLKQLIGVAYINLGKAYMKKGDYQSAVDSFVNACHNKAINSALGFLEEIYANLDKTSEFKALCDELKAQYKDIPDLITLNQWHLETIKLSKDCIHEYHIDKINESWQWIDEFSDCSYKIEKEEIKIQAANGRNLFNLNLSAPRLMYEISGDFAIEVSLSPTSDDKPQMGGLLIWKDKDNFIRFERGTHGKREMRLEGYVDGKYQVGGRGLLPASDNDETHLRLERSGDEFTSYCSVDGENWFTCGKMILPLEDPIQVGIHAIGMIDRTIYCEEFKEGTATLFRNFRIWTK